MGTTSVPYHGVGTTMGTKSGLEPYGKPYSGYARRPKLLVSGGNTRLAMAKVEGSNPFIRFERGR